MIGTELPPFQESHGVRYQRCRAPFSLARSGRSLSIPSAGFVRGLRSLVFGRNSWGCQGEIEHPAAPARTRLEILPRNRLKIGAFGVDTHWFLKCCEDSPSPYSSAYHSGPKIIVLRLLRRRLAAGFFAHWRVGYGWRWSFLVASCGIVGGSSSCGPIPQGGYSHFFAGWPQPPGHVRS